MVEPRAWNPDDRAFWAREGVRTARRNLAISTPALALAFAVWMMWSVVVVELPRIGFNLTANQLFWLAALPGLSGAVLRIFFSFMVPLVGGRRWTAISTAALIVPAAGLGGVVQDATTPLPALVLLAVLSGIGGGNFASSMGHVSLFYPAERRGAALGWNAGLGNLGVVAAQLVIPLVIAAPLFGALAGGPQDWTNAGEAAHVWLQNAGFVWVPFLALAAIAAWFGLDDVAPAKRSLSRQAALIADRDTWLLAWLYLGTFGSFIGFAAGMPLVMSIEFPHVDTAPLAFLGPLGGALTRPLGGWLADRAGGARIALACFGVLALATAGLLMTLGTHAQPALFTVIVVVLFIAAGMGNGAVFSLIPAVFVQRRGAAADAVREGSREGAAALGFASGIAAFGGFFIPKAFGTSASLTGDTSGALYAFLTFYVVCVVVASRYYKAARSSETDCVSSNEATSARTTMRASRDELPH